MTAGPLAAPVEITSPPGRRKKPSRGWWTATAIVLLPALIPPISLGWQVLRKGTGATLPLVNTGSYLTSSEVTRSFSASGIAVVSIGDSVPETHIVRLRSFSSSSVFFCSSTVFRSSTEFPPASPCGSHGGRGK